MLTGHLYEGKGALLDYISSKIDVDPIWIQRSILREMSMPSFYHFYETYQLCQTKVPFNYKEIDNIRHLSFSSTNIIIYYYILLLIFYRTSKIVKQIQSTKERVS